MQGECKLGYRRDRFAFGQSCSCVCIYWSQLDIRTLTVHSTTQLSNDLCWVQETRVESSKWQSIFSCNRSREAGRDYVQNEIRQRNRGPWLFRLASWHSTTEWFLCKCHIHPSSTKRHLSDLLGWCSFKPSSLCPVSWTYVSRTHSASAYSLLPCYLDSNLEGPSHCAIRVC